MYATEGNIWNHEDRNMQENGQFAQDLLRAGLGLRRLWALLQT